MITDPGAGSAGLWAHSHMTATGDAQVGQQIGAQFVDSVFHGTNIYCTSSDDPPDHQHRVARTLLDGGNPRRAEEILAGLLGKGEITTERAYFYVLAVLSDRPFTEITADLTDAIHHAMRGVEPLPRDEWRDALDVVDMLLRYAHAEFEESGAAGELAVALDTFGGLTASRQDEIDRHLNLILSGAVQERLSGLRKYRVAARRMDGDRAARAWKFFEAEPRPPMRWPITPAPASAGDWRDAVIGSVATLASIGCLVVAGSMMGVVIGMVFAVVGGLLAFRGTAACQAYARHGYSVWWNYQVYPHQQETAFDRMVDQCFRDAGQTAEWEMTAGYRAYLKRRLQWQYGPAVYPGELRWLVRWHAARSARLRSSPPATPPEIQRANNLRIAGVLGWAFGVVIVLMSGNVVAAVLAGGSWLAIRGIAAIVAVTPARHLLDRGADALLADEWTEYQRWTAVLADRPSDAEMERWLAMDKAYLRDEALRRANLRERDLVTYVVLTEHAPFARKGRVTNGPTRYEAYHVYVFLLTRYGMRTTRTFLRVTTGETTNEQREMFTYDAVASASVVERGSRIFGTDGRLAADRHIGREFRLTLVNGTCIAEVRENSRARSDDAANGPLDEDDEAPNSRFDSALRVLEAVATEGRDWIARDLERRRRWARNWVAEQASDDRSGPRMNLVR